MGRLSALPRQPGPAGRQPYHERDPPSAARTRPLGPASPVRSNAYRKLAGIEQLTGRFDPHVGAHTARDPDGNHVELTVYRVIGVQVVNARIEEDGDIHLVIADKYDRKMIVEFPNTVCKGAKDSAHADEMKQ